MAARLENDISSTKHCLDVNEENSEQVCIPVGCVPPACCSYLPAWTAPGCEQNS